MQANEKKIETSSELQLFIDSDKNLPVCYPNRTHLLGVAHFWFWFPNFLPDFGYKLQTVTIDGVRLRSQGLHTGRTLLKSVKSRYFEDKPKNIYIFRLYHWKIQ